MKSGSEKQLIAIFIICLSVALGVEACNVDRARQMAKECGGKVKEIIGGRGGYVVDCPEVKP